MNPEVKQNSATVLKEGDVTISCTQKSPLLYRVDKVHEDNTMDITTIEWDSTYRTWRYGCTYRNVTMDNLRKV